VMVKVTIGGEGSIPHTGTLESEDNCDEIFLSPLIMEWSWESDLWNRINAECHTDLDEYEGVWLDSTNLLIAARIIREDLDENAGIPTEYVKFLLEAPDMLERCATRHVRVMFSL
jgi:hypothetical protein